MHLFSEASDAQFLTTQRRLSECVFSIKRRKLFEKGEKKNDLFQFHKNPGQDNVQAVNLSLEMKRLI